MNGVIAAIAPQAKVIDICHDISDGDIRSGAFTLTSSCRFFPTGSVHVAIVDPGVGSKRRAIAVRTKDYVFVGPDNGVLSLALADQKVYSIHQLANRSFFLTPVSNTFQGRDVFAPVAAYLTRGVSLAQLGPVRKDFVKLKWPKAIKKGVRIYGEVVYIDKFGNGLTNVENQLVSVPSTVCCELDTNCEPLRFPACGYYGAVGLHKPVAVPGSTGFLEIAVNGGSAQQVLGLEIGTKIRVDR